MQATRLTSADALAIATHAERSATDSHEIDETAM
jgi:hypothetical protein